MREGRKEPERQGQEETEGAKLISHRDTDPLSLLPFFHHDYAHSQGMFTS